MLAGQLLLHPTAARQLAGGSAGEGDIPPLFQGKDASGLLDPVLAIQLVQR